MRNERPGIGRRQGPRVERDKLEVRSQKLEVVLVSLNFAWRRTVMEFLRGPLKGPGPRRSRTLTDQIVPAGGCRKKGRAVRATQSMYR